MSNKFATAATFHDLTQAQAARASLEGAGIATELLDEATGSIDWGLMPALGGLRLQVSENDLPRALEILEQLVPDELAEDPANPPSSSGDDDLAYRHDSGRRKRRAGLVALLLLLLPLIIGIILMVVAWLAG
jgi:hypothetical protein